MPLRCREECVGAAKDEKDEGNKELDSIFHQEVGMDDFSENGLVADRIQSCPSVSMMKEHGSFTMQNDQLDKLSNQLTYCLYVWIETKQHQILTNQQARHWTK